MIKYKFYFSFVKQYKYLKIIYKALFNKLNGLHYYIFKINQTEIFIILF